MRLHRLEITAFGPFATTEDIDMGRLAAGGLFLLEGPTGSGKSTILDAIVFALYGGTAGSDSSPDRLHSHFADPATTPSVTLELSVRGERLRITRVPEHERPKKRGEGTTIDAGSVRLERMEAGRWVDVSSHVQEVAHEIGQRIGLSRDQFTKVVLLPQGEFATFLKSDDRMRRSLLTQIFGASLYDRVTTMLEERRRDAGRRRSEAQEAVRREVAAAGAAAGLDDEDAEELAGAVDGDLAEAMEELAQRLATEEEAARVEEEQTRVTVERAGAEVEVRAAAVQAHDALAAHRRRADAHEASRTAHRQRVDELSAARRAAPVVVLLDQLDDAEAAVAAARERLLESAPDADEDERAGRGGRARESAARAAAEQAAGLQHLVDLEAGLPGRRTAMSDLAAEVDRTHREAARLAVRQTQIPAELAAAQEAASAAAARAALLPSATAAVSAVRSRLEAATALDELAPRLADAIASRDAAERRHLDLRREHLDLRERQLADIAAELAGQLVDDRPCPVCGSTAHPAPASPAADHVTVDQVRAAAEAEKQAEEAHARAQAEVTRLDLERTRLSAECAGLGVDALQTELAESVTALRDAQQAVDDRPRLDAAVSALRTEQSTLSDSVAAAATASAAARAAHESALGELDRDTALVAAARSTWPSVAERASALRADASRHREVGEAIAELSAALRALAATQDKATAAAAGAGFGTVTAARAAVRTADALAALEAQVAEWDNERAVLEQQAADPRLSGLDPADAEAATALHLRALRERDEATGAAARAVARRALAARRMADFSRHRAAVDAAVVARSRTESETAPVIRLAGLANGTAGGTRMTLTSYVLRQWFEQVVAAANLRLRRMSSGRYELERTDDTESRAQKAGLALRVIDLHTGEARSPSSLSGGETFYTSLALALGLADVVRAEAGGVDLDTLFIDEGFGTLDPETLEMVMSVIDDLRDGGRAVGIVSHVAELKDRVTERLEVSRVDPQGPSTTRVVA